MSSDRDGSASPSPNEAAGSKRCGIHPGACSGRAKAGTSDSKSFARRVRRYCVPGRSIPSGVPVDTLDDTAADSGMSASAVIRRVASSPIRTSSAGVVVTSPGHGARSSTSVATQTSVPVRHVAAGSVESGRLRVASIVPNGAMTTSCPPARRPPTVSATARRAFAAVIHAPSSRMGLATPRSSCATVRVGVEQARWCHCSGLNRAAGGRGAGR